MKLIQLMANLILITTSEGNEYLFSYDSLVAGFNPDNISPTENGYWFVGESYSNTTTRHIKYYLENLYTSEKTTKVDKVDAELAQTALM